MSGFDPQKQGLFVGRDQEAENRRDHHIPIHPLHGRGGQVFRATGSLSVVKTKNYSVSANGAF